MKKVHGFQYLRLLQDDPALRVLEIYGMFQRWLDIARKYRQIQLVYSAAERIDKLRSAPFLADPARLIHAPSCGCRKIRYFGNSAGWYSWPTPSKDFVSDVVFVSQNGTDIRLTP